MATKVSKQQRNGKSYLHAVVRDAARPYTFRASGRRLLQRSSGQEIKNVYSHLFMPSNFKYLQSSFNEYGYGSATPVIPPNNISSQPHNLNFRPEAIMDSERLSENIDKKINLDEIKIATDQLAIQTPQKQVSTPDPTELAVVKSNIVDVRIPDSNVECSSYLKYISKPENKSKNALVDINDKNLLASVPDVKKIQNRLSKTFSLNDLARQLEADNFSIDANMDVHRPSAGVPTKTVALEKEHDQNNKNIAISIGKHARGTIKDSYSEHKQPLIKQSTMTMTAQKSNLNVTVGLNKNTNTFSGQNILFNSEQEQVAHHISKYVAFAQRKKSLHKEKLEMLSQEMADKESKLVKRKSIEKTRSKRVAVVRNRSTAAFWERSQLARLELRMYR